MLKSFFRSLLQIAMPVSLLTGAFLPSQLAAQGDLLIAPTRVILDGRRGTEVILSNIGAEEATYRIGLELRRMEADGSLTVVEKSDANDQESAALQMIRYAPRRISLPPGQPQAVRIAARPGAELPDGEYRVHMSFKAIPKPQSVTDEQQPSQSVAIRLIPIYGVTIPVIVRHGRVSAEAALSQPRIEQSERGPQLALTIERKGDSSTYGELRVVRQGDSEPLFNVRGVAVYPELDKRDVRLRLTPAQAAQLAGPLRIEYREMPEKGGSLIAAIDTVLDVPAPAPNAAQSASSMETAVITR